MKPPLETCSPVASLDGIAAGAGSGGDGEGTEDLPGGGRLAVRRLTPVGIERVDAEQRVAHERRSHVGGQVEIAEVD